LFSSCINWHRLKKGKSEKRSVGAPAASVATAVDHGGKDGGASSTKRSNSSLLEKAVCVMGALASDSRANAGHMELHKEDVALRVT
jgi:hypothetical protein